MAELGLGGAKATKLIVSHAFHSPQMQPMVEKFAELLRQRNVQTVTKTSLQGDLPGVSLAAKEW